METALFFKAKKFLIFSSPDVVLPKREDAKKILAVSLIELCEHAKKISGKGKEPLEIIMEPFDRDYNLKLLIGPTDEAIEVTEKARKYYDNVGLMIDFGHLPF